MNKAIVDFTVDPAKVKCSKCGQEIEIPPQKKLSDTIKIVKDFEIKHATCV